jgi:hypothetical protein
MAYQAMNLRVMDQQAIDWHNEWNALHIKQAHILHFHGSRGTQAVINIMRELCNQLAIKI